MGLKVGRNANQFTFSTKFPRKPRTNAFKPKTLNKSKDSYSKFAPKLPFGAPKSPFIRDKVFKSKAIPENNAVKPKLISGAVKPKLTKKPSPQTDKYKREQLALKKEQPQTIEPSISPLRRVRTLAPRLKKPLKKHKNFKWDPNKELANVSSQFDFHAKDFTKFGLVQELTDLKYAYPSKVQVGMITRLLKGGDLLVGAQTGTGKTLGTLKY
jgi:hypothetical protein